MEKNDEIVWDNVEVVELKEVETVGIQSHVKRFSEIKKETVTIGHAQFFDFEDINIDRVVEIVKDYLGYGFVFKSSNSNYHVIKPQVKSVAEINSLKSRIQEDCSSHNDIGLKKGCWTLRAESKGDKPKPRFLEYVESEDANPKEDILSKPHLQYLNSRANKKLVANMLYECKTVGDTTNIVKYSTHENNHEAGDC